MHQTSTTLNSLPLLPPPFTTKLRHKKFSFPKTKRPVNSITAMQRDAYDKDHHNGRLVDENMIVLRQRIHEMNVAEKEYEPPEDWMEWEKKYYKSYDSDIVEAMGCIQYFLMENRPSLALGMVGFVVLSVAMSMTVVGFCFLDMVKEILAGMKLNY